MVAYFNGKKVYTWAGVIDPKKAMYGKAYIHERNNKMINVMVSNTNCENVVANSDYAGVARTTTLATTTPDKALADLHERVGELEKLIDGKDAANKLLAEQMKLQTTEIDKLNSRLSAADTLIKETAAMLEQTNKNLAAARADTAGQATALEDMRSDLSSFVATPSKEGSSPGPTKCSSASCPPEIAATDSTGIKMSALEGAVLFESSDCDERDLCELAKTVDTLASKFGL